MHFRNISVCRITKKKAALFGQPSSMFSAKLFAFFLFKMLLVFIAEFIHTTGRIDQLHLSGIERMRGMGNLQLDQRVFLTVFSFDGFFGFGCRF